MSGQIVVVGLRRVDRKLCFRPPEPGLPKAFSQNPMTRKHSSLAAALAAPAGVTHVSDRGSPWPTLPAEISRLHDLQYLTLNECGVQELPDALWDLTELRSLNLFDNAIGVLSAGIGRLRKLEKLVLGTNDLRALPSSLAELTGLKELNLANNPRMDWKEAFSIICRLEGLERLSIYQNAVGELPEEIGRLKRLRVFKAFACELRSVPASTGELTELRELDLRANAIDRFDVDAGHWEHLERLDLSFNRLPAETCERITRMAPASARVVIDPQEA